MHIRSPLEVWVRVPFKIKTEQKDHLCPLLCPFVAGPGRPRTNIVLDILVGIRTFWLGSFSRLTHPDMSFLVSFFSRQCQLTCPRKYAQHKITSTRTSPWAIPWTRRVPALSSLPSWTWSCRERVRSQCGSSGLTWSSSGCRYGGPRALRHIVS